MRTRTVSPSVTETAFNCPHCGALSAQYWYDVFGERITGDPPTPSIPDSSFVEDFNADPTLAPEEKKRFSEFYVAMKSGEPFLERGRQYAEERIHNLFLSNCYNCHKLSVWISDKLIYPPQRLGPIPNPDLPQEVISNYEEARSIVMLSPEGAAALLRLCVQKLCVSLGQKGENINDDIAELVAKGLNPLVQKSLDIVRVIGNEAVHPGVIELNDDPDTANQLFDLVNAIAEQMISHPKRVSAMYEKLPPEKRKAIERRDAKTKKES